MKKKEGRAPVFRLPLRRNFPGVRPVSRDRKTLWMMLYLDACRRAGDNPFPDLDQVLAPLVAHDRLFFFVNRLPVVLTAIKSETTGALALSLGDAVFRSTYEVAVRLRLDVRCGISERLGCALIDAEIFSSSK